MNASTEGGIAFLVPPSRIAIAAAARAAVGPSAAPAFKSNPSNPKGLPDEHGEIWKVWNPALVGIPIDASNAQLVNFIKEVFLESQITLGFQT